MPTVEEGGGPDLLEFEPRGRGPWIAVAAAVVGLALGAVGMHALDERRTSDGEIDLRVSLGPHAGDISGIEGDPVVDIPLLIDNASGRPVVLAEIVVEGPGATSVKVPDGPPRQSLPFTLVPGRPLSTRIAIRSDCSVPLRPAPVVTLVVVDAGGQTRNMPAAIPGLASLWGQTLYPLACPVG